MANRKRVSADHEIFIHAAVCSLTGGLVSALGGLFFVGASADWMIWLTAGAFIGAGCSILFVSHHTTAGIVQRGH